jgi:hypothetical protein
MRQSHKETMPVSRAESGPMIDPSAKQRIAVDIPVAVIDGQTA